MPHLAKIIDRIRYEAIIGKDDIFVLFPEFSQCSLFSNSGRAFNKNITIGQCG